MIEALKWIRTDPKPSIVCTDSMSLQQALANKSWRSKDNGVNKIRTLIREIEQPITVVWVPSHCGVEGNERADVLADEGTKLPQEKVPVSHAIVKAKIKARKWTHTYDRAEKMYGKRRKPKMDIEKAWPRKVRTLFSRLRSGHAKQLKRYMYMIEKEDDPTCDCGQEEETIEHVLCRCPALEEKRARMFEGEVTIDMMVYKPEKCRKLLESRYPDLKLCDSKERDSDGVNPDNTGIPDHQ